MCGHGQRRGQPCHFRSHLQPHVGKRGQPHTRNGNRHWRIDFTYNSRGERTGAERFSNVAGTQQIGRSSYGYDSVGRVTDIDHFDALDVALAEYDYVRDVAGQITEWSHHGETIDFTHDLTGQLTGADYASQTDESYSYDANGNRTGGGATIGPNNQILSDGTYDYDYDAEGNLVTKTEIATGEHTEYDYDHHNRMTSATSYSAGGIILKEVEFIYDVFDRRIAKTVDADGAGAQVPETVYTAYDGEHAWADFDESGDVDARYLFGNRTDEIVARWRLSEGTAWYLTDHLGTIRDIVNASGALINTITYDSFGNIVGQTNSGAGDRFSYTGREFDAELSLYYYRARFYDSRLGRFISQDPLGFAAGDVNLYRYVGNNAIHATDPSGKMVFVEDVVKRLADASIQSYVAAACTIAEIVAENGLVAPWNNPSMIAEIALRQIAGAAGGRLMGIGMGLMNRFILRSLTLKITASVAAGVGGLGFATAGIYDAWKSGNEALFWVRFTCTTADVGMMVGSLWRTMSRARMATFDANANQADFDRLNTVDADTNGLRPGEAKSAARGEIEFGTMERAPKGRGDFVITTGINKGKSIDFKLTPFDSAEAARINKHFGKTWPDFREKLIEALKDPAKDIIAIGINSLESDNQAMVHGLINSLPQDLVSKIALF